MTTEKADILYMKRCFALASKAGKEVKDNPKVGAVLVYNDRIIGEGYHRESGGPHAEVNCIRSVHPSHERFIPESILYVTLEPCCHHGKTPPCTSLILQSGIKDVRISATDPSDKVKGKGIQILKDHGIKVRSGILENEGLEIIRAFAVRQKLKRPYIILKIVKSKDNYIGQEGKKIWMTCPITDVVTHKWRSEVDGILIGTNTAINDQPSLTTRNFPGEDPIKMVVDRFHKINSDNPVLSGHTMYFTLTHRNDLKGSKPYLITTGQELESILQYGLQAGIHTMMIEGGTKIIQSFYNQGLWDEARVISTPLVMGHGIRAINIEGKILRKFKSDQDLVEIILRRDG